MKHDLFISYSRKDFDVVNDFVKMLKSRIPQLNCWFDITGIESGDEFEDKIISAIDNSEHVLFALSDNSLASTWTKDEVMYAKNTEKKIIPLLLKGAELKGWFLFRFGRVDCIDITDSRQVDKLISNLSTWTNKPVADAEKETTTVNKTATTVKDENRFEIVMESAGEAKLEVVKVVKESLGLGLKEAKELIDSAPCTIIDFAKTSEAWQLKIELEKVGARVKLVKQTTSTAVTKASKLYMDGKYDEALKLYTRIVAETNDARAQYCIGSMYHNGKGIANDYNQAFFWWNESAKQNYTRGIHYVGYCYEYGMGVAKDINKAKEYYKKAADLGYEKSKEDLQRLG